MGSNISEKFVPEGTNLGGSKLNVTGPTGRCMMFEGEEIILDVSKEGTVLESGCIGCVGRANCVMFCYCRHTIQAKFKLPLQHS